MKLARVMGLLLCAAPSLACQQDQSLAAERVRALALARVQKMKLAPWRLAYSFLETFTKGDIERRRHFDVVMEGATGVGNIRVLTTSPQGDMQLYVGNSESSFEVSKDGDGWQAVLDRRSGTFDRELVGPVQVHAYPYGHQGIEELLAEANDLTASGMPNGGMTLLRPAQPWIAQALADNRQVWGQIAHALTFEVRAGDLVLTQARNLGSQQVAVSVAGASESYELADNPEALPGGESTAAFGRECVPTLDIRFSEFLDVAGVTIPTRMEVRYQDSVSMAVVDPSSVRVLDSVDPSTFAFEVPPIFGRRGHIVNVIESTDRYYGYEYAAPQAALANMVADGARLMGETAGQSWGWHGLILPAAVAMALGGIMLQVVRLRLRRGPV